MLELRSATGFAVWREGMDYPAREVVRDLVDLVLPPPDLDPEAWLADPGPGPVPSARRCAITRLGSDASS